MLNVITMIWILVLLITSKFFNTISITGYEIFILPFILRIIFWIFGKVDECFKVALKNATYKYYLNNFNNIFLKNHSNEKSPTKKDDVDRMSDEEFIKNLFCNDDGA